MVKWKKKGVVVSLILTLYVGGLYAQAETLTPIVKAMVGNSREASLFITFEEQNVNWTSETNADLSVKIMNHNKTLVSKVGCHLYDDERVLIKSHSEDCNLTMSSINFNCNIMNDVKYTLTSGTTYYYELFVIINELEYKDGMRSFTTAGFVTQEPMETPEPSKTPTVSFNPYVLDLSMEVQKDIGVSVTPCEDGSVRIEFPGVSYASVTFPLPSDVDLSNYTKLEIDATVQEQFGFEILDASQQVITDYFPFFSVTTLTRGTFTEGLSAWEDKSLSEAKYIKIRTLDHIGFVNAAKHTPITLHSVIFSKDDDMTDPTSSPKPEPTQTPTVSFNSYELDLSAIVIKEPGVTVINNEDGSIRIEFPDVSYSSVLFELPSYIDLSNYTKLEIDATIQEQFGLDIFDGSHQTIMDYYPFYSITTLTRSTFTEELSAKEGKSLSEAKYIKIRTLDHIGFVIAAKHTPITLHSVIFRKEDVTTNQTNTPTPEPTQTPTIESIATMSPKGDPLPEQMGSPVKNQTTDKSTVGKYKLRISDFTVFSVDNKNVTLKWDKNPKADYYELYRSKTKKKGFQLLKKVGKRKTVYVDKDIKPKQKYYYKMRAVKSSGDKMIKGNFTPVQSIRVSGLVTPIISIKKGKTGGVGGSIKYLTVQLKRYSGNYIEIYFKVNRRKYKMIALNSNRISKGKEEFKIRYLKDYKNILIKARTYDRSKKRKVYSNFSRTVRVKL